MKEHEFKSDFELKRYSEREKKFVEKCILICWLFRLG